MVIRVAHIITGLLVGGAEMMLYKLLQETQPQALNSIVICLSQTGPVAEKIESIPVPVYELGMPRGLPTAAGFLNLARITRRFAPDIIQGWMYHGNLAAQAACLSARGRPPVVWNIRNTPTSETKQPVIIRLGRYLSSSVSSIVYNSRLSAQMHEAIGYNAQRTRYIANGFDTAYFQPDSTAASTLKQELDLFDDAVLIGLMARYHPMKDHKNFFAAAARILKAFPQARFILAGHGIEAENQELMNLIRTQGLEDYTHLLGVRHDMPRLMASLEVLVSSSSSLEGFSNSIGEAMACGVPCVVTDTGDSAEIIGASGFVVPPRDAEALAEACLRLLNLPVEERKNMGQQARERIITNYSLLKIAQQYIDLYTQLLQS